MEHPHLQGGALTDTRYELDTTSRMLTDTKDELDARVKETRSLQRELDAVSREVRSLCFRFTSRHLGVPIFGRMTHNDVSYILRIAIYVMWWLL